MVDDLSKTVAFRVTAAEDARIRAAVDASGLRMAQWLRQVVIAHLDAAETDARRKRP